MMKPVETTSGVGMNGRVVVWILFWVVAMLAACGGTNTKTPEVSVGDVVDVPAGESTAGDSTPQPADGGDEAAVVDSGDGDSAAPDACEEGQCLPDVPAVLPLVWTNLGDGDLVTVGKKVVLEFEAATPMPENEQQELLYNEAFQPKVTLWDADARTPGQEVSVVTTWRPVKPGLFRKPALVLQPLPCDSEKCPEGIEGGGWHPDESFRVTVSLGDQQYARVFRTFPSLPDQLAYAIAEFEVPVPTDCDNECDGACDNCFPFPVKVMVFIPPGYRHSDDPCCLDDSCLPGVACLDNSPNDGWDNGQQRYPLLTALHSYGGAGGTMADAYGWATLPKFTVEGVVEPTLFVLPDGTVPQPYCGDGWKWPFSEQSTCYTQFLGIPAATPNETTFVSYTFFLANTLPRFLAGHFRLRSRDDGGSKIESDAARRGYGIAGLTWDGWGALMNAFKHPEAFGAVYGLMPPLVSIFNPWAYWSKDGEIDKHEICNTDGNGEYPREPVGDGYRDLSMIDPHTMKLCGEGKSCKLPGGYCADESTCEGNCDSEAPCPSTGLVREIVFEDRHVPEAAGSCFWLTPEGISNEQVADVWCGFDVTCQVDPGAPDKWRTDFDAFPFDGNIFFMTGSRATSGPPAAFFDLDQQLDKRGVVHGFRYEDSGGIYPDWNLVHDYIEGWTEITRKNGTTAPGNFPETGHLYPFLNNAFEGLGNRPFNHPSASEFTTGAMDPDRDHFIDLIYPSNPDLNFIEDNCPGVYNPDQKDSDGDGIGDACSG